MGDDSDEDGDNTVLVAVPDAVIVRGVRAATALFLQSLRRNRVLHAFFLLWQNFARYWRQLALRYQ